MQASLHLSLRIASARQGPALAALSLAVLLAQVDTSVANLATREIGAFFGAGVSALQWVIDAYNLVYAVLLLTGGLLADLYGRRLIFLTGAAVLTLATALCGAAPGIATLIAARAIAGLGAALLIPASLALIRVLWPDPAARGRALGVWAACNGVAMAIGPTLGGALIRGFGWRSVFLAVVPLGAAAFAGAALAIGESADPQNRCFDVPAQVLGAAALGALVFAAIELRDAPNIAALCLALCLVAFTFFLRVERRQGAAALVPLDLFRSRAFNGAMAAAAGMTFGMYGALFLLPLTWQSTGRLGAAGAGIALLPMALVFALVSPASGPLASRAGNRVMTAGGLLVIASGLAAVALGAASPGLTPAEFGLAPTGLGMGLATGPLTGVAVGSVAAARSGTASSMINVARMSGASLGVAILGAVFSIAGGGEHGLRLAMVAGSAVQAASGVAAWVALSATGACRGS